MRLMKPIISTEIPTGEEWAYEVKYDGFRCVLRWEKDSVTLISKNDTNLTGSFPEIITYCHELQAQIADMLPLELDGELVVLNDPYQANFSWIQKRGRLKNEEMIKKTAGARPASFMAFDMLQYKGESIKKLNFKERKKRLVNITSEKKEESRIHFVPFTTDYQNLWDSVFLHRAEGLIAKRLNSPYGDDKKHNDWFKIKNWRTISGFLTFYNPNNDYFTVSIFGKSDVRTIGKCKHGLNHDESAVLKDLFFSNGIKETDGYRLPPAICAEIQTLDLYRNELREPQFSRLLTNFTVTDCTIEKLKIDMSMFPKTVEPTNTDKTFWPLSGLTKGDLLVYIREIAPYMLPFLHDRRLTVIRCPDGVNAESFFQKHLPDYAPEFIKSVHAGNEEFFTCNDLNSLLWFANHGAVEYHIPFQSVGSKNPAEIVFDLDPPDRDAFPLAIKAALLLKQILDNLELISFAKTSGGKGLQVHIPIPPNSMTYDETATFTQAIAWTIENEYPKSFTTERLKRNRAGRLYIDYVQHAKDKTIIAPYSPRKTADATVATPLFWDEVEKGLTPDTFTISNVIDRVLAKGCPFYDYYDAGAKQEMEKVLQLIK